MKKVAIFCATGFEEGETLLVADILRRGDMSVSLVSITEELVTGGHAVTIVTDRPFGEDLADYNMLVVPGGACAETLKAYAPLKNLLQSFACNKHKWVTGICSGLRVLENAGVLTGKQITFTPNEANKALFTQSTFIDEIVVQDGNLITSRAPGMSFAFAFALLKALGGDANKLSEFMQYPLAKKSNL